MSREEIRQIHEERLNQADKLYEEGKINWLELGYMKDSADNEYRRSLTMADE